MSELEELEPLRLLEDEPVASHEIDELSLEPFSRVVAETAIGTKGPFTIGVFADWGLGKTSILRQAKTRIEALIEADGKKKKREREYQNVVAVWFNAWQFEKEEHPLIPLVSTIVREVETAKAKRQNIVSDTLSKSWSTLTRALRSVAYGVSVNAKFVVPGGPEIAASLVAKEIVDRWEELKPQQDPLLDQSLYFNAFQLLEELVTTEQDVNDLELPKIVVFIDDLDRCMPNKGLHLLESIKLVLCQRGFVFVLAVDNRILEGYLEKRYREDFNVQDYKDSGTSYLDKIVQLPLYVPSHQRRFDEYIAELLKKTRLRKEIGDKLDEQKEILALGSNHNPRSLVRLINNLLIDQRVFKASFQVQNRNIDEDFLSYSAISRSLRLHLGSKDYNSLVYDQDLCTTILNREESEFRERFTVEGETSHLERGRLGVLDALEKYGFMNELLKTDVGKRWLEDEELRRDINEFLIVQRQEQQEAPENDQEVVEREIRRQLRLSDDSRITQELRSKVQLMDLSNTSLNDSGLRSIRSLRNLQKLILDGNGISGSGLSYLKDLSELQSIHLRNNRITDASLRNLQHLDNLENLDLSGNLISDTGLKYLDRLFRLRSLYLRNNQIAENSLVHIKNLIGLEELHLTGNMISSSGLAHLKNLVKLRVLHLGDNTISDSNLEHLAHLADLQALGLSGNRITGSSLEFLRDLSNLKVLYLRNNQIPQDAFERVLKDVKQLLPNCNIIL